MRACLICLGPEPPDAEGGRYHAACLQRLFGVRGLPRLDLDLIGFPAEAEKGVGKMSISGAQRKAFLRLSADRCRLEIAESASTHILKPQLERYVCVPENEHVSMCIAQLTGVAVPPFGLITLTDGSWAYIVKRYDRSHHTPPRKLMQVDFCQLSGRPARERGHGTAEECAGIVRFYADQRDASLRDLFRLLVVSYWIGNGDLHLKNLSLLRSEEGEYGLSPAYDLICTWVYRDHHLTLPVGSRTRDLRRGDWLDFAERHASIPRSEAVILLNGILAQAEGALALLSRCALPEDLRKKYQRLLGKRTRALGAPSS